MKNKISIIILMLIASISFSQFNISTDSKEVETWDGEEWNYYSSSDENTFFEFEDTAQSKMGMFIHRTDDITSAYLITSYTYNEEYDLDDFKIVSDVGNKYTLLVKINSDNEESIGALSFVYTEGEEKDFRLVTYNIKSIWVTEDEIDESSDDDDSRCVSGDCENGYGVYKFSDDWEGDVYKGNFKDGKRHGYGTYYWSEGSKYEGNWSNGNQHGEGKYTFADGEVTEGEWSNGEFIDETSDNSWIGGGTGFFIDRKGYFATNYHVVEDATYIEIEFYRDGELQNHKAEVIKTDKNNDLAILKISDEDFERFDEIPYYFSTRVADIGEEVFALGYPLTNYMGKDIKFTDGKISSKTGYDGDIANYQTTTPIQPGNSGGPLFDYEGNLIAINAARFTYDNSQNVSYSIKSTYLKNLIDVLPVNLRLPHNKDIRDLKLTEKIKVISDYVVLIRIK